MDWSRECEVRGEVGGLVYPPPLSLPPFTLHLSCKMLMDLLLVSLLVLKMTSLRINLPYH